MTILRAGHTVLMRGDLDDLAVRSVDLVPRDAGSFADHGHSVTAPNGVRLDPAGLGVKLGVGVGLGVLLGRGENRLPTHGTASLEVAAAGSVNAGPFPPLPGQTTIAAATAIATRTYTARAGVDFHHFMVAIIYLLRPVAKRRVQESNPLRFYPRPFSRRRATREPTLLACVL